MKPTTKQTVMQGGKLALAAAAFLALPPAAKATLINGPSFAALAFSQSFDTSADGTVNPTSTVLYAGSPLTISYGPYFAGQSASSAFTPPTSVVGSPSSSLSLDTGPGPTDDTSYQTSVEYDYSVMKEVVGGAPAGFSGYGGPIAILFSQPVAGVALTAGYFDGTGATRVEAFTADGTSLSYVTNLSEGLETFNLRDSAGLSIAGLLLTSTDGGGFAVDGVGAAVPSSPPPVPVPEPAFAILPGLLAFLFVARRR